MGHILLGICLLLRAALWTAGGLTAAVFAVVIVPFEVRVTLYSDKFFDEWLGFDSGKGVVNSSLLPALDIVSTTVVRDGEAYPWTTDTHSFLPFLPDSVSGPGNYTFDTEAYWATVECNTATVEDLVRVGGIQLNGDMNSAQLRLDFRYEGCDIRKWFTITNTTLQYGRSWSVDCSLATGQARFGIVSGVYNNTEKFRLSNLTVVTCKPLIYRSNVTLDMSLSNGTTAGRVLSFTETSRQPFWPAFASDWLNNIPLYAVYDPTVYNDMDTFSRLVIGHALGTPTLDTMPDRVQIVDSFVIIFEAFFSNFVTLQAYFSAPRREITGNLSRQKHRLFVVKSASFAVIGIITTAFVTTLILAVHLRRNRFILEQYLDLMLGNAFLLRDSPGSGLESYLAAITDEARKTRQNIANMDLVKFAKEQPDLNNWLVWVDGTPRMVHAKPPMTP